MISSQTRRFDDKVVLIVGASSGIGRAVAERLAREGARLYLVAAPHDADDLDSVVETLSNHDIEVSGVPLDIASDGGASAAVAATTERFGRLDALVCNAGIAYYEEFLEMPVAHLDRTLAVNVRGTFLFVQAAARAMRAHGGGAISITVSSAAALGEEFQVVYNASKAGVAAMTRSLAVDLAPYGIRVNGVSPGWVETRSTHPVIADPQLWAKYRSRIPLDRAAATEEIAAVHAFLLSEDASYVTGVVVAVDGGLTAGMRWTGWAAVVDPGDHDPTRIPELPPSLGRKTV